MLPLILIRIKVCECVFQVIKFIIIKRSTNYRLFVLLDIIISTITTRFDRVRQINYLLVIYKKSSHTRMKKLDAAKILQNYYDDVVERRID